MVPVYDYWEWAGLTEADELWRYYHPEDDPESDLHYSSLDTLVSQLVEDNPRGEVEIIAVPYKDGPWHKIEVSLEAWCRHFEPELLV